MSKPVTVYINPLFNISRISTSSKPKHRFISSNKPLLPLSFIAHSHISTSLPVSELITLHKPIPHYRKHHTHVQNTIPNSENHNPHITQYSYKAIYYSLYRPPDVPQFSEHNKPHISQYPNSNQHILNRK